MKQEYLDQKLKTYSHKDIYPFHMPGHKRKDAGLLNPFLMDITEIDDFDNLHQPEGILKQAQERTAKLYGAKESFFLINGSTAGILSAVSAITKRGDTILMARNSHKSVYNAVFLRELQAEYLYPAVTKEGIQASIEPADVEKALQENTNIKAVLITSPTYEGVLSDVKAIAECVHKRGILLIVDEAHGAHLGFSKKFPNTALHMGADIVIQSMHKTLPALTQTALLHIGSERVNREEIKKYLSIYQTSSPSYVLMASMDRCNRILETQKEAFFLEYERNLFKFIRDTNNLEKLKILTKEELVCQGVYQIDPSKLLIYTGHSNLTGTELSNLLREKWHLELEMASGYYALAMTSIMDSEEAFFRLTEALKTVDTQILSSKNLQIDYFTKELYGKKESIYSVFEAEERKKKSVLLQEAKGKIAAEYIFLYPPGIPVLVPGEKIEEKFIETIIESNEKHLNICGLHGTSNERINIVFS